MPIHMQVSDFGLSQVLPEADRTQVSTKYSGTVTHMPPELIEDGKVYQQGDVYAFGIIMWEVRVSINGHPGPATICTLASPHLRPSLAPPTHPDLHGHRPICAHGTPSDHGRGRHP